MAKVKLLQIRLNVCKVHYRHPVAGDLAIVVIRVNWNGYCNSWHMNGADMNTELTYASFVELAPLYQALSA